MDSYILDPQKWAEENFGDCDFGDKRLTDRLVAYAELASVRPDDSTPHQTQSWKNCRAVYRFMDNEKVSYEEIVRPHCERTRARADSGVWLSICDTTELSFSLKRRISGLKSVGDGKGQGFFLHSSLLVSDDTGEIAGLAAQELYYRIDAPKGEGSDQRKKRKRESEVWGRVVEQIGRPQPDARIVHVCDRAADDFEFFCHAKLMQAGWVVRVQHKHRSIHQADDLQSDAPSSFEKIPLLDHLSTLPSVGTYELAVKANKKQAARTAHVEVSCTNIWMPRPKAVSKWVKENGPQAILMGVVQVRETKPPRGQEPLHWILYTDEPMQTFEDCWRAIGRYEKRPIVEDYHKAAKTGAQIENRLYRKNKRLERVVGVLAVTAARILQMRTIARVAPEQPARKVVPKRWLTCLCAIQRRHHPKAKHRWNPRKLTIREFMRGLAMLGGFLARKCDGEPGWITIWRGVKELLVILRARRRKKSNAVASTCGNF